MTYHSIKKSIWDHSERQLSVLGLANIANCLVLSKFWHVITVHRPMKVQSTIRKFVAPFSPAPAWFKLCQAHAFQFRAIQRLLSDPLLFASPILMHLLSNHIKDIPLESLACSSRFLGDPASL